MEIKLETLINKFKGKKIHVLGLGPSLAKNKKYLEEVSKDDDSIIISCNNCDIVIPEIKVDYWVWVNGLPVRNNINKFNTRPETKLVWASSVDGTQKEFIESNLKADHIPFNQWVANKKNPWKGADETIIPIQKLLSSMSGNKEMYSNGHTVAVHMITLAILLGASEVEVTGVDMDYSNGYACNNDKLTPSGGKAKAQHEVDSHAKLIENDLRIIFDSAEKVNCEINDMKGKSSFMTGISERFRA